MNIILDTPIVAGSSVLTANPLGVLGSTIPSNGTHGPALAYEYVDDPLAYYRTVISDFPDTGSLVMDEDSSFVFTAPDGTSESFGYIVYKDGVQVAADTETLSIGDQGDTIAPVITLLGANPVSVNQNTTYTDAGATALDNVDGDISGNIVVVNPVNTATPGQYTVTYNVDDAAGNSATQVTRTVNVVAVDTTKPVITLTPNQTAFTITVGDSFTAPTAVASDNVDADVAVTPTGTVDTNTPGVYTLTYSHTDTSGNAADDVVVTVTVQTAESQILEVAATIFTLSSKGVFTAYAGALNRALLTFKPDQDSQVKKDVNGNFDFDDNNVTKVEVYAKQEMIDSSSASVTWSGSELSVQLGALNMPTSTLPIEIAVYVDNSPNPILFAGPGMDASIIVNFQALGD